MDRLADIRRFYSILDQLEREVGGMRTLNDCHGRMGWPRRGVYFFFEPGQHRSQSGDGLRVVRVGTHALTKGKKSTFWQRLSQHRGSKRSGGGNHRGSIFRLHVGTALINRDGCADDILATWGSGSGADKLVRQAEQALEQAVSLHIGQL